MINKINKPSNIESNSINSIIASTYITFLDKKISFKIGDKDSINENNVILTEQTVQALGGDICTATQIFYLKQISRSLADSISIKDQNISNIMFALLVSEIDNNLFQKFDFTNSIKLSIYMQFWMFGLQNQIPKSLDLLLLLQKELSNGMRVQELLGDFYNKLNQFDLKNLFQYLLSGLSNPELDKFNNFINKYLNIFDGLGILGEIENIETKRIHELNVRQKQSDQKEKQKNIKNIKQIDKPGFRNTYDPKDSIKSKEKSDTLEFFGYFEPSYSGYIKIYCMNTFDENTLKWSVDDKNLTNVDYKRQDCTLYYHTKFDSGLNEIPALYGYKISYLDVDNQLLQNKAGDLFLHSKGGQSVIGYCRTDKFAVDQTNNNKLLFDNAPTISNYLDSLKPKSNLEKLKIVADLIKNKYYTTEYQGSFVENSQDKNKYFELLWQAEKMECYSANTLLVVIARQLGFEAKLAVGYTDPIIYEGKSYLTQDHGHAWTEIKINNVWQIVDVTPINQEKEEEKAKEEKEEKQLSKDNLELSDEEMDKFREKMKQDALRQSSNFSDSAKELIGELPIGKILKWENFKKEKADNIRYIPNKLGKFFQFIDRNIIKKVKHTARPTNEIDIEKLINENPGIIIGDLKAYEKLQYQAIYQETVKYNIDKIKYPKEIEIFMLFDLSGSVHENGNKISKEIKDKFMETVLGLAKLNNVLKKHGSRTKLHAVGFGNDFVNLINETKGIMDTPLILNTDAKVNKQLINIADQILTKNMGGTQDHLVYAKLHENLSSNKSNFKDKVRLGVLYTDAEVQDKDKANAYLQLLEKDCEFPFISVMFGNGYRDGYYRRKINANEGYKEAFVEEIVNLYQAKLNELNIKNK